MGSVGGAGPEVAAPHIQPPALGIEEALAAWQGLSSLLVVPSCWWARGKQPTVCPWPPPALWLDEQGQSLGTRVLR